MQTEAALLNAIKTNPQDDFSRLAYADWLEEQGDTRADFLRMLAIPKSERTEDTQSKLDLQRHLQDPKWLVIVDQEYGFLPNRVLFPGNPWPRGHAISQFDWSARLTSSGEALCDLHLESADYYAEDEDAFDYENEDDDLDNWQSKIVWGNYHSCTISSTEWHDGGFVIVEQNQKFSMDLFKRPFLVDPLPLKSNDDWDDLAFYTYLLGHDSVANHHIRFYPSDDRWSVEWRANVALTYAGDDEFRYEMRCLITDAQFSGVYLPDGTTKDQAERMLAQRFYHPQRYAIKDYNGRLVVV